jgi:beta-mannanase
MAFGVAMLPQDVPGVSLQACADGSYDAYWREFGRVISSYGLGQSIIRLGWEFNGNWYVWQATDPTTWVRCWQQVVTSARSTAPRLQWDWNVNRGLSGGLADPALAYPGNAYVNIIGVDSYDWWPPATTAVGWQTQLNGVQGLNYWLAFAKAHGKRLSVPEWGNIYTGNSAGGDDPQYVKDMRAFFAANAEEITFECNFQASPSSTGGSYGPGTLVPKAAEAYKAAF